MMIPDYRLFANKTPSLVLAHSAKGSEWKEHKYVKRVDGTYYYPEGYEGGRTISSLKGEGKDSDKKKEESKEFDHRKAAGEFNKFLKQLSDSGEAYYGSKEEWENMTLDEFRDLYEDILGRKAADDLSDKALENMFKSAKAQNTGKPDDSDEVGKKGGEYSEKDIENLAKEVIKGNFDNGAKRKELLGEDYEKVQKKVNEMMKSSSGSKKVSSSDKDAIKKAEETAKKATSVVTGGSSKKDSKVHSGVDMKQVQSVYKKKKKK